MQENLEHAADGLYAFGRMLMDAARFGDAADVFRLLVLTAPRDERGWLGLGACHEAIDQWAIATELYMTGRAISQTSARCEVALARALRQTDGDAELMAAALERASQIADANDDDELRTLVAWERGRR